MIKVPRKPHVQLYFELQCNDYKSKTDILCLFSVELTFSLCS